VPSGDLYKTNQDLFLQRSFNMKNHIPAGVRTFIGMVTLFTMSPSWAAQLMAMSQNQNVIAEFSVPVRLSALDRRIHSGKVQCTVIQQQSGDNMFGLGGLGTGNAIFSINPGDGSFSGNVKVTVVPGKGIQDSDFAGGLKYACWLYLSPDGNTWSRPDANAKEDMFKPKPASSLVGDITGSIPASK
jgi:hypothetical protein